MDSLLSGSFESQKAKEIGAWFASTFRVQSPKTPKGQKALKDLGEKFRWWLEHGSTNGAAQASQVEEIWKDLKPHVANLVKFFSDEGGVTVPKQVVLEGHTFQNLAGFNEAKLNEYAQRLVQVFHDLKGWRSKALSGGVTVGLASPREFRGTAGGTYKSSQDVLLVRATPDVLSRGGAGYGSFEYIIVHELGHRYERKNSVPLDFDKASWYTSRYSKKEGESFAELFALSNFGMTRDGAGSWDADILDRFEKAMHGQVPKTSSKVWKIAP